MLDDIHRLKADESRVTQLVALLKATPSATKWPASTWRDLPSAQNIHADGVVLALACALVFASALLAGLLPAIRGLLVE